MQFWKQVYAVFKSASNIGEKGNADSTPGQEDPLEDEMATHFSTLA